jgi:hypothetical protein
MASINFNEREYKKLLEAIALTIDEADQHFRSTHAGLPVDVVRADVVHALPENITLPDEDLDEYAQAVADGEPFEFRLLG